MATDWTDLALVGRSAEVERLIDMVRQLASGHGGVVSIQGEPGIGKSVLLSTAVAAARRQGIRVCSAAAERLESRLPFAAIGASLGVSASSRDRRLTAIARMLRGEVGDGEVFRSRQDVEIAVTESLVALVDDWCAAEPVVVALDDLQWADPASVVVTHLLGRAAAQMPLLLLGTCRTTQLDDEVEALLKSLASRPGAVALELAPLDEADTVELAECLLNGRAGPRLRELVAGAAGNPLYIGELVRALERAGEMRAVGDVVDIPAPRPGGAASPLPVSLATAIRGRLEFLSRPTRDALQVAALLGAVFTVFDAAAVSRIAVPTLATLMTEAAAAGVLQDAGGMFAFRHDLIRQALLDEMPTGVRAALHHQAAGALLAAGASVERIGGHLLAGGTFDGVTRAWLLDAVEELRVRAPGLTVDLLAAVLAGAGPDGELRDRLHAHLATALLWSGRFEEAEDAARAALATLHDPALRPELRDALLLASYRRGRLDMAIEDARSALAAGGLDAAEERQLHSFLALGYTAFGQLEEGEALAQEVLAGALRDRDDRMAAEMSMTIAANHYLRGDHADVIRLTDQGLAIAARGSFDPFLRLNLKIIQAGALNELDRHQDAQTVLDSAAGIAERTGGSARAWYHAMLAGLGFRTGRWDDALTEVEAGFGTSEYSDEVWRLAEDGHGLAALIAVRRGDLDAARSRLSRVGDAWRGGPRMYEYWLGWAEAMLAEAAGRPDDALDRLFGLWKAGTDTLRHEALQFLCPDIARLAAVLGDRARLDDLATDLADQAAVNPLPSVRGAALMAAGLLGQDRGRLEGAEEAFAEAGWQLHRGLARECLAILSAGAGRPAEARAMLDRALEIYGGLEAAWDAARATAALRGYGITRGVRGVRHRPRTGWPALTETELRVAGFVAEGQSNPTIAARMYLSRRTVQSHVSSILAKLGLSSRVEIAIEASKRLATEAID
jgi:DNA-binding CsgD family transcriptional regulator